MRLSESSATLPRMRRWTSALVVVLCACLGLAAAGASAGETRLNVQEKCSYTLRPDDEIVLRTAFTVTNARSGRPASVRIVAGWQVHGRYVKAQKPSIVQLGPGRVARRTVTRTMTDAPVLWKALQAGGRFKCSSTKTYTVD